MDLQQSILAEFHIAYPQVTLKKASELLGIQITRVFRLLNGQEMKLKEYEKFKRLLGKTHTPDQLDLNGYRDEDREEIKSFAMSLGRWNSYRQNY